RIPSAKADVMIRFAIALLVLTSGLAYGKPLALGHKVLEKDTINAHLEYMLEEPGAPWTLEQVLHAGPFAPLGPEGANFGYLDSRLWLRVTLKSPVETAKDYILTATYPSIQYLTYFEVNERGEVSRHLESGKMIPAPKRPLPYRAFGF